MSNLNSRAVAAGVVAAVVRDGISLDRALESALAQLASPRDAGFVQELSFGVMRWRLRLEASLTVLLRRPFKRRDMDVHALLLVGLYQLIYLRVPDHAAVAETVSAVKGLKKQWARGLVNATLRNFLRRKQALLAAADQTRPGRYSHPLWLIEALKTDWPDDWRTILDANNEHPPMTLRVNRRHTTRGELQRRLTGDGLDCAVVPLAEDALTLLQSQAVGRIPGFNDGDLSVQDAGAQLAVVALACADNQRVLDACAAPGGKTCHILERHSGLAACIALDVAEHRVHRVHDNLTRLGLSGTVCCGDAGNPQAWWDGVAFDRILLDAPCSGSGVIRRHPDIKTLRRPSDIDQLVDAQSQLLASLWQLLAPGGRMVYATCSVLKAENEQQIAEFLHRTPDARVQPLPEQWGRVAGSGRQILPGENGMDGFYYASLAKTGR